MLRLLLGMLLVGCAMHGGGPVDVKTSSEAAAAAGKKVRIAGTAQNAKLGAAVDMDDLVVFLLDRQSWPADRTGKAVVVEGVLERTSDFVARTNDAGEISQGTGGPVWVIRKSSVR
jgi:hypothetical protein